MRNPKYHIYLTSDERRTVINSLLSFRFFLQNREQFPVFHIAVQLIGQSRRFGKILRRILAELLGKHQNFLYF